MDKKEKRKLIKLLLILLLIVVVGNVLLLVFFGGSDESGEDSDAVAGLFAYYLSSGSEEISSSAASSDGDSDDAESTSHSYEYEIANDDEISYDGISSKQIGSLLVYYKSEDGSSAGGISEGAQVDLLYFNDGNEDDLKGALFAIHSYVGMSDTLETQEDAEDIVGQKVYAWNTGVIEWEECTDFFVRQYLAYNAVDEAAYYYYTIVPKSSKVDTCIYYAVFMMYEDPDDAYSGDGISESSYETATEALLGLVPDCSFFTMSYVELWYSLFDTMYWETANGNGPYGGVTQLKASSFMNHFDPIYGDYMRENGKSFSELTYEERYMLDLKYSDLDAYEELYGTGTSDEEIAEADEDTENETASETEDDGFKEEKE